MGRYTETRQPSPPSSTCTCSYKLATGSCMCTSASGTPGSSYWPPGRPRPRPTPGRGGLPGSTEVWQLTLGWLGPGDSSSGEGATRRTLRWSDRAGQPSPLQVPDIPSPSPGTYRSFSARSRASQTARCTREKSRLPSSWTAG